MDEAGYRACSGRPLLVVWARSEGIILCSPFGGSCVSSTFHAIFLLLVFSFVVFVLSFLQKSNCLFWSCLSTFWRFVLLCSDLKVVFKRITYPVLSWCYSSLGTVGFLFLSC